jgi:hypothetical protein
VLEAHALDQIEALAPEIDHVAAVAKMRGYFHERWLMAMMQQPVRQRGSCDAGAAYAYPHPGIFSHFQGRLEIAQ